MEYHCNKSLFLMAASLLFLHGCAETPSKTESEPTAADDGHEDHHVSLPTIRLTRTIIPQTIEFPGKVNALPDQSISISPNIAGKISKVLVVPGQQVGKGRLIALLDDLQLKAQLKQAEAPQKAAMNAIAQAKISLDLAEKNLARAEALFEKDIGARKDVVTALSLKELSKSQVEAAEARYAESQLAPTAIATQVNYTKVYSPIAGVVAQRFLNVGSAVDPSTPIVHIVNLKEVMVYASMPADSIAKPRVGQRASITTVAEPEIKYSGEIKSISPIVDANNNSVSIELLAKNPQDRLKEGQQVTVSISTSKAEAMLVPETAIVPGHNDPSENFVYLVKDNKLKLTKVSVGEKHGGKIPVFKGLVDGQEIVESGVYGVPDGAILDRVKSKK
ncbi:MAG: efflux RND transporter periplasmic adaptor subunit [Leptolyngbya sp.]|nr:efflux RND transporter periplasmic adaptor subunit [Candidatus Melainabacteria bacterium]